MIKLIASDLDGTLAHADGSIPKETFSCVRELREKGIQFVFRELLYREKRTMY